MRALAFALVLAVGLIGCMGHSVPYHLPQTVLVPLTAAGIDDRSEQFGDEFCAVLSHLDEGGPWGSCGEYIETTGQPAENPAPLPTDRQILVIPGFMGKCFSPQVRPFSDALDHLRTRHGMTAEIREVPALGSCEHNAEIIAKALRERSAADPRPIVLVGYSKGGCDAMTALAIHPDIRPAVAALVTVAAPVSGSRIPDLLPDSFMDFFETIKPERCEEGDGSGMESLRRPARQKFLRKYPEPFVPTFSIVAVADEARVSRALRPFWDRLAKYSLDQDGMVIASEAIPPRARFLGVVRADHWAVALPYERWEKSMGHRLANENHFPRAALLEAALRVVLADPDVGSKPLR